MKSKNERLKGKMSDEERKVLKDELQMLNGKLENLVKAKKNLDSLIYKLDVSYEPQNIYIYLVVFKHLKLSSLV